MSQPVIIVTGANGQLGSTIQKLSAGFPQFTFVFPGRQDLSIDQFATVQEYFAKHAPAYCINCAAYTAVDKAETEKEQAMLVNGHAVGILASVCKLFKTRLIHISTDYVFDGTSKIPYTETAPTNPVNYYGASKLAGEEECKENNNDSIIIRTSWVYAESGNNFVKTMMRLMKERTSLNVVNDQFGSPTYAVDLAKLVLNIIAGTQSSNAHWLPGIYHYSNQGVISWFDFATAIQQITKRDCTVLPVPTTMYPTPAKRPAFSVMDKEKVQLVYNVKIPDWKDSLTVCIEEMEK